MSRTPAFALFLAALLPAQTPTKSLVVRTFDGSSAGDQFGFAVAAAGDVDRDGVPDLIAGAPRAGTASVFSGKSGELLFRFRTGDAGDAFGYSVAGAGDVNGDAQADLLVGAPLALNGKLRNAGAAFVYSGRDGKVLHELHGDAEGDSLGWSVLGTGDLDDDGRGDFAIGVPYRRLQKLADCGIVLLISGKTGKTIRELRGERASERFGWSLANALDLNGDRVPELLVGVEGDVREQRASGCARAFSGRSGTRIWELRGAGGDDYQGTAVGGGGDLDGDGRNDLLIGAFGGKNDAGLRSGSVLAFTGTDGRKLLTIGGRAEHDRFGHAIAPVGDLDADGCADVAIGAPQQLGGSGYVLVCSGKSGDVLHTFRGEADGDSYGAALAWLGDGTLAIGAPGAGGRGRVVTVRLDRRAPKR